MEPERDKVYQVQEEQEEEGFRLEPERKQACPMQEEEEEGSRLQYLLTPNEWVFGCLKKLEGGREMGW